MKKEINLVIQPDHIHDQALIHKIAARKLKVNPREIKAVQTFKRSIDARGKKPVYRLKVFVYIGEEPAAKEEHENYRHVDGSRSVIIIGSGPAGLFAGLKLLEMGLKPIILERGKDVRSRRKDIRSIQQEGLVNTDSNYCFGEGGAGTFSDGKLYTRSTKRGNVKRVLDILVQHGAQNEILIDAHPHIGSNVLPKVVENIRSTIENYGGEVHFNNRVTNIIIKDGKAAGVEVNNSKEVIGNAVILAAGHSARDIYYLLDKLELAMEIKPFAVGVRAEHQQSLIDEIQYHSKIRNANLPASSYNLTCQVDNRGIYSFCMCPGGLIIPSSTEQDELVLNGMSVSRRDSKFSNSGIVVTVLEQDLKKYKKFGVFAGIEFQKEIERKSFTAGGGFLKAPAQRLTDFIAGKVSADLPETSYIPGVTSFDVAEILPKKLTVKLRKSLLIFNNRMKGYLTREAQILAGETRTSSPIKIVRDKETLMHPQLAGLFPSGEGAGYAGGIISAAIDGQRCAEAAAGYLLST